MLFSLSLRFKIDSRPPPLPPPPPPPPRAHSPTKRRNSTASSRAARVKCQIYFEPTWHRSARAQARGANAAPLPASDRETVKTTRRVDVYFTAQTFTFRPQTNSNSYANHRCRCWCRRGWIGFRLRFKASAFSAFSTTTFSMLSQLAVSLLRG